MVNEKGVYIHPKVSVFVLSPYIKSLSIIIIMHGVYAMIMQG